MTQPQVAPVRSASVPSNVQSEVYRLLGLVFRRPVADTENPTRDSHPEWDSLKHLEIVFLMEDHFEIHFDGAEIATLHDAREIVRLVEARLAP